MKSLKWLLVLSLFFVPVSGALSDTASAEGAAANQLTVQLDSKTMIHNGNSYLSVQPLTLKNGSTFIAFRSVADRFGYKISYDAKTKESVATSSAEEIRLKPGSLIIKRGKEVLKAPVAPFAMNGSLMVPLRTWSIATDSKLTLSGKTMTLTWSNLPTATFAVSPEKIYAGETVVTYIDRATSPTGQPFVDERWDGKMDVFPEPGSYTVTRQVQDASGEWSEPYSVTVEVLAPNMPPVADFKTEKEQYRIGEEVLFTDLSYDDENAIVKRTWSAEQIVNGVVIKTWKNQPKVFFEAGDYQVTLEVQDAHGLTHMVTKTVTVTSEVLYTEDQYNRLFTKVGDKFTINGASVLDIPAVPYKLQSDMAQFVRSNSPEIFINEGIAYEDQLTGPIRFLYHNFNSIGYPVKMYLIATNNSNTTVNVNTSSFGIGGPDPFVENTGKLSTVRYLKSLAENPTPKWTAIKPGQSVNLMPELSKFPIKPNQVISAYGDVYAEQELQFRVVVVAEGKDPIKELPSLSIMDRYDIHVRGTFNSANRSMEINEPLGYEDKRIVLGDTKLDSYLVGYDATSGKNEINVGNFGVVYTMKLNHVAPNTLITVNPRGGHYTGAFLVNGELVTVTNNSILQDNTQAGVLYRTGDTEESVEIVFTPASGSNLPIAMLFQQMPPLKY
ncbi:stalk domain-containing protein [Paenibacillus spongiae]|uniref:Copper amine oxidase N-terminal domain-containing protein n=1 Tax=Paenibacillus spongiae TaxID=2909671 RepID=A0ABY5SE58_9BACL|nr:stalk domain-containing protein [Paenibacillus spongiae]UVI32257.1 copper amine oxidase N-terminal domain-containing protein [Paenibacillus spongiae]